MKILMITEKDAANQSLARIAKAYMKRKHTVVIYATYYAKNVLREFDEEIYAAPFDELNDEIISSCDIIFATSIAASFLSKKNILFAAKPIFTHNYLINRQISWGGDFCFVPSIATVGSEYDVYLNYPYIEIGEPKYDSLSVNVQEQKMLLFIDSGHYPFGWEGKKELARTLIEIARISPDYELWIKPRFLPGDTVVTHKNTRHLYDIIREEAGDNLPANLLMLIEHRDLKELIDLCHTVICMHSTAFVGAYAAGKGLIVLDGLPSEDVYDVRWKDFNRIREEILPSGAVVPYKNVKAFLPDGVRCSEEYKRYLLAEQDGVAEKICEVTEYFYNEFYRRGKFPKGVNTSYSTIKKDIVCDDECDWNCIIRRRCEDYLLQRMLILIDYNIKVSINIQMLLNEIRDFSEDFESFRTEFLKKLSQVTIYRDQCIIENYDLMLHDDIDSGILLNALYRMKQGSEIKAFPKKDIGAFYLFRGFVASDENDMETAVLCMKKYIAVSVEREYIKEVSDMPGNRARAFKILLKGLMHENSNETSYYLYLLEKLYHILYPASGITDSIQGQQYTMLHWMKQCVSRNNQDIAGVICGQKLLIYGAGVITREILLQIPEIRSQTVALIDNYLQEDNLKGIPVIRHEDMNTIEADLCIVAVPHLEKQIKEKIEEQEHNFKVVGVNEMF